jgi:hypothetical protein
MAGSGQKRVMPQKEKIKSMREFIAIINVLLWSVFIWMDRLWNNFLQDAISRKEGIVYGDLFGPLSYFRPKILFLSYAVSLVLAVMIFYNKKESKA